MADTDEVVLDESTPGDGQDGGSPDLGASVSAQDAVYETIVEVWAILGTAPIGRAEFAFSEAQFKLHTSAAMQSSSIEMIRSRVNVIVGMSSKSGLGSN